MATKTILSLEQFEQLPDDGLLHELDEGDLVVMPPPKPRHGTVLLTLGNLLKEFLRKTPAGSVTTQIGFLLKQEPATVRAPDVAFLRGTRAQLALSNEYIEGAPDLAVEIVSPSDSASQMMRKVNQYLRSGGHTVWVVYPESRQAHVFEAAGTSRVLGEDQTLDAPNLLPGFSVPVKNLFE